MNTKCLDYPTCSGQLIIERWKLNMTAKCPKCQQYYKIDDINKIEKIDQKQCPFGHGTLFDNGLPSCKPLCITCGFFTY